MTMYRAVDVNGATFTPDNWAFLQVTEANGNISAAGWYKTSAVICIAAV